MDNKKTTKFNTRKDMLEVIHNMHRYVLDSMQASFGGTPDYQPRNNTNWARNWLNIGRLKNKE